MNVWTDLKDTSFIKKLYADDAVLCGQSVEEVVEKYDILRRPFEGQGLSLNVSKTKGVKVIDGKKSCCVKVQLCCGKVRCGLSSRSVK